MTERNYRCAGCGRGVAWHTVYCPRCEHEHEIGLEAAMLEREKHEAQKEDARCE